MNYDGFASEYRVKLNEQQTQAVKSVDGNILLVAVPGSGKTTVLVTRLAYMIKCLGINPGSILTMTYTVAATADMRRRYEAMFGPESQGRLEFRTINSLCCDVIRTYEQSRSTSAFPIAAEDDRQRLISEIWHNVTGEYATEADRKDVCSLITYAKNMQFSDMDIDRMADTVKSFPEIYRRYIDAMNERRLMDFDDQLRYALSILRRCPDILEIYRKKYRYICVDEAQDTSKIQHSIIRLLSVGGNIFMVGDEDQSIYGFRAAYPKALVDFEKVYENAKVLYMEENFRSTKNITGAADAFITQNTMRRRKHMTAAREDTGAPVLEIWVRDRNAQYRYILNEARNCKEETAVLYRDNSSALPIIDMLERENVPYSSRGVDAGFFSSHIVRDVTDIIRFASDMKDGTAFLNIYYKINTYLDRKSAQQAAENSGGLNIPTWLFCHSQLKEGVKKRQIALRHQLQDMLAMKASDAIEYISEDLGYAKYLEREQMSRSALDILIMLGDREESPLSLLERLRSLEETVRAGSHSTSCPFVLSTIHSSKGLEYDRVFLADVFDGVLPQNGPDGDISAVEEERRIFYVGMTRARNELNIFRFTDRQMPSDFATFVFGRSSLRDPAARQVRPVQPRPVASATPDLTGFAPGATVRHDAFGRGTVVRVDAAGDRITVRFRNCGEKTLILGNCVSKGLLRAENC